MGKSSINGPFSMAMLNNQRVIPPSLSLHFLFQAYRKMPGWSKYHMWSENVVQCWLSLSLLSFFKGLPVPNHTSEFPGLVKVSPTFFPHHEQPFFPSRLFLVPLTVPWFFSFQVHIFYSLAEGFTAAICTIPIWLVLTPDKFNIFRRGPEEMAHIHILYYIILYHIKSY